MYNLSFNADTRSLKLESSEQFIGTAYDDNTIVLKFQINDPNGKLADMSGRVQTGVKLTDIEAHRSFYPPYPLDDFNQVILPKELLASATSKRVPITLIYENATVGEEQQIASNEVVLLLSEVPKTCPKNVRLPDYTSAFHKAKYDATTGILSIWAFDNAKTTVRLERGTQGSNHYEVDHVTDLTTITDPYPGDTAMVKLDSPYGKNAWYVYVSPTIKWVAYGTFFTYGKSLDVKDLHKIQLKDADGTVISEIEAPGGQASLNGKTVNVNPTEFKIYAPPDSGSAGQYLTPQGASTRPKWQSPDTTPTENSTKLITSDAVYKEQERAKAQEQSLDGKVTAEQSRATAREEQLDDKIDTKEDAFTLGGDMEFASGRKLQTKYDFMINGARGMRFSFYAPTTIGTDGQFAVAQGGQIIWKSITGLFRYKGSKPNFSDLPTTGNEQGDVWNIENEFTLGGKKYPAGTNVAWNGSAWDPLGGTIDLTPYLKIAGHLANKVVITDNAGNITTGSVAVAELNHLTGLTVDVQTKFGEIDTAIGDLQTDLDKKTDITKAIPEWSATITFVKSSTVLSDHKIYESLLDNNLNHPVTDKTWWKETSSAGGGGGSIFTTTIGNGTDKEYTVTHNLGTSFYIYNLQDVTGLNIDATVETINDVSIKITFYNPPATNSVKVIIMAGTTSRSGFLFEQTTESDVWNINHGLGRFVTVQTWDATKKSVEGAVTIIDNNNVKVEFNHARKGFATIV